VWCSQVCIHGAGGTLGAGVGEGGVVRAVFFFFLLHAVHVPMNLGRHREILIDTPIVINKKWSGK